MTGQNIIDKFYDLVDDDGTTADRSLELLNTAYDALMTERLWNFLRKEDSSIVLTGSTLSYNLPADFMYPVKVFRFNASNDAFTPMGIVPFNERMRVHKRSGIVYFDLAQAKLMLSATPSNQNISGEMAFLLYQYQPAQLTVATSPVFNRAFHSVVAYEMAKIFWYMDQQEKDRSFNREMQAEYDELKKKMIQWDSHLEFGINPTIHSIDDSWVPGELMAGGISSPWY